MRRPQLAPAGVALIAALAQSALAQPPRPTVDVYIRGQAGLPPSSARGDLEMVQMGEHAVDPVFSIVGHRISGGWHVSYVCAQSPSCDPKKFVLAKEFDLKADAAKSIDAVLGRIEAQPESDGPPPSANEPCGRLAVAIEDQGAKRNWRRTCAWGPDFAKLETLLKAGLP